MTGEMSVAGSTIVIDANKVGKSAGMTTVVHIAAVGITGISTVTKGINGTSNLVMIENLVMVSHINQEVVHPPPLDLLRRMGQEKTEWRIRINLANSISLSGDIYHTNHNVSELNCL